MRRITLTIILASSIIYTYAQQAGLGFVVGVPQNDFRLATEAEGYGLNLTVMGKLGTQVVTFGGNINYMIYGLSTQNETLEAEITAGGSVIDSWSIPLRMTNTNGIFGMHGIMRITAPTKVVRPYIEGLFGFRYIHTTTKIEDVDYFWTDPDESNVLIRRTNLDDWILSYGGGGGLQFQLKESMYLDFRAYYLLGSEAEFYDASDTEQWEIEFNSDPSTYDRNTLDQDDLTIAPNPKRSTTDMIMFQLGITFQL